MNGKSNSLLLATWLPGKIPRQNQLERHLKILLIVLSFFVDSENRKIKLKKKMIITKKLITKSNNHMQTKQPYAN